MGGVMWVGKGGFGILILIWIWSLVFGTNTFQILALYLDFESARNIHVLEFLLLGFGGYWRLLTRILHLDLDLALYLCFEGAKNIHFLLVLLRGFWRCLRCLTGVWHLDLDLDIVTG